MKWSCITLAAFAALLLLPPTHSRHHALLLLCRPIYYSSWVHYSKTCTVGPPFCHELSLLSRRLAFDDEDGLLKIMTKVEVSYVKRYLPINGAFYSEQL